jgi:hypothetical protein
VAVARRIGGHGRPYLDQGFIEPPIGGRVSRQHGLGVGRCGDCRQAPGGRKGEQE